MGNTKLRREKYFVGTSGVANVSSRHTKVAPSTTASTPATTTAVEFHPTIGPMLSTSIPEVTAPARVQLPIQSMPSHDGRRSPVACPAP